NDSRSERTLPILHRQPGGEISEVVLARGVGVVILRDAEGSEADRKEKELGEVGPRQIARPQSAEQYVRGDLTVRFRPLEDGQVVEVSDRRRGDGLVTILREWDVASQSHPVVFDHLACPLCARQSG